ncbi:MAG TPA: Na+/H+ antiporter subunit E [Labilithrix sp.]|nr:Na+/H+ antiporter subunit E [Labilithrix sp.]
MDNGHEFALRLRAGCWRALLLGFGWWALTEGDPSSLAIGLTMVAAATLASLIASPPQPITLRPRALVTLAGGFLYGSLLGGWDVARRALAPSLPISPALIPYSTRLDSMPAQQVFTSLLTLMPGTFPADTRGRDILIHALVDRGDELRREITTLERRVARTFDIHIDADATEKPNA